MFANSFLPSRIVADTHQKIRRRHLTRSHREVVAPVGAVVFAHGGWAVKAVAGLDRGVLEGRW